jgi:hypothetical protein
MCWKISLIPEDFDQDIWYWGNWLEGLEPFYTVEWIRVRPRYTKKSSETREVVIDITDQFIQILQYLNILYVAKQQSVYIYGYVHNMDVFHHGQL